MKLNIILSLIFAIVTSFTAIHEVEHIAHEHDTSCLVCHVNNNLVPTDDIIKPIVVESIHFDKITYDDTLVAVYFQERNNQNRAPPSLS